MARKYPQIETAREYIERFPTTPTRTLATKCYKENKALWPNPQAAYTCFRRARGNQGAKSRERNSRPEFFQPNDLHSRAPFPSLPEGITHTEQWGAFEIPGPCNALCLGDIHVPYHDDVALRWALQTGLDNDVDTIILNGDAFDFYACSYWETDPRQRDFPAELDKGRQLLAGIREGFPDARIIWKIGNHEERYERYMIRKAPELLDVDDFQLEAMFRCEEYGVEVVSERRPIKLGQLFLLHGHEYKFAISNPVNPARGMFLRGISCAVTSHFHQSSQHSQPSLEDKVISCWSTGCLCDLHPDYMPLNKWNHGFALLRIDEAGKFRVINYRIIDGEVYE